MTNPGGVSSEVAQTYDWYTFVEYVMDGADDSEVYAVVLSSADRQGKYGVLSVDDFLAGPAAAYSTLY